MAEASVRLALPNESEEVAPNAAEEFTSNKSCAMEPVPGVIEAVLKV